VKKKALLERARKVAARYRVTSGRKFRLRDCDAGETMGYGSESKPRASELLKRGVSLMSEYQDRLYAQDRWAVLLVFQAMDAAGKDSAIKHVMSGVNPQGCQVYSFKAPTSEELDHDYLWRCSKALPERGRIGIFNRSYYEEVLVVRVHPELLAHQKLPPGAVSRGIWKERFEDIVNYERYLARNGIAICKFFLNVSREEQKQRFLDRLDQPEKNWKFSESDVRERQHWDAYMKAYEQAIRSTATPHAPWYVVPADNKWFTRLVVAAAIIDTLDSLDLRYPEVGKERREGLEAARRALLAGD
jgi:PPK2 family polyphosphate:nucleotide phosphotransferase